MLKCKNWSMEMELQKWEEKLSISVLCLVLTIQRLCWGLVGKTALWIYSTICWEKSGSFLAWHCHTSILHCISSLQSLFNVVIYRSSMLCQKARSIGIPLIRDVFTEAPQLSYTTFGFNDNLEDLHWCWYNVLKFMRRQAISTREQRTYWWNLLLVYLLIITLI